MKNFFGTFIICLILCYVFLFFGGALILENFLVVLVALIIAILITVHIHQDTKIEKLEARIKTLESQNEPQK